MLKWSKNPKLERARCYIFTVIFNCIEDACNLIVGINKFHTLEYGRGTRKYVLANLYTAGLVVTG